MGKAKKAFLEHMHWLGGCQELGSNLRALSGMIGFCIHYNLMTYVKP